MVEVDEAENLEFKWGKKRGVGGKKKDVQFYESFTYDGLDYTLYDNVYLHKDGESEPFLGKLIKIFEHADKAKKVKVLWFFRPFEISNYLTVELAHPNEIFLASGEGQGLANVNPLEAIAGKCNVLCISKDSRNPQPSDKHVQMADYVFYRTFDVGQRIILDKIDEKIAGIDVRFIFNQPGSLKPCSALNISVDVKNASQNAMETNGRDIMSKLSSSENRIPDDDRQEEQKPVFASNDRQENDFNHKTASSSKVEEKSDVKVSSVEPNISRREKLNSGVVTVSGQPAKTNDRRANTSGEKTGFGVKVKENADMKLSSVKQESSSIENTGCANQIKVDEKLKSIKDRGELDERPHKKAKLDSSVKVSNNKENSRRPADPRGTAKNSSKKLIIDDKLTKPANSNSSKKLIIDDKLTKPANSNSSKKLIIDDKLTKPANSRTPVTPPNDDIKSGDKTVEVTRRPDSDRSKWFAELPWEESMQDAHEHGTLVLFQNLDPTYTSREVEDIVWNVFKETCRAKMVQKTAYSSPHYGQAFAIFKTRDVAEEVIIKLDGGCLMLPNRRPLVASIPNPCFSRKQSTFAGHLIIDKLKSQREMKEAVSTSHSSQPNTLEYDMAMEWCLIAERSNRFWKKLHEQQGKEIREVKAKFKSK